ncbi:o-succinylbenzoate--CoA ligase [Bacillus paralicheniformis]|uniref:o-succinylbenzoate--CoA ligase n=1 Tax=Bacillus paralicheniformis TaxID=1648923 RepID=UPI002DBD1F8E|nr:o-succinylbenzoate--CoA ligase [Bacillus paralicheniformis]MEC1021370.1 o-succinylbenzoate--CoA ligase [Bacillus paralicheniformis]MEC1066542.1 o-succinylbenzoate--CoA ligase [Bacillus paralicheniformis]MEC1083294.1 o-succinylbenzoate--CoA ligase [Bacillus paralicheniformis]MEC1099990.1 o-succinylbenzoate--CoA ligase [Bacillus paralicheniformis]MEC1127231.1 o-succinylbenzoate--CoA ligase [Bacillus paralicheniformis]
MLMDHPNWLKQRAELTPDRMAVIQGDHKLTFIQLFHEAKKTAGQLKSFGLRKGDTAAVLLTNRLEIVIAVHACFLLGVRIVLLNTKLSMDERTYQIEHSEAKLLLTEQPFLEEHREGKPARAVDIEDVQNAASPPVTEIESIHLDDAATIMYTSGTTGRPKGVMQTFANHYFSAVSSALNLGLQEHDRWLIALPLFHISGLSALFKSVIYGMTVVLHQRFDAEEVLRSIKDNQVTIASVVQTMLSRLAAKVDSCPESLRCLLLGGGPAPLSLLEECKRKRLPVVQSYGMTETCSQIATLAPEHSIEKLGSAGKPLFASSIKIEKNGTECHPGEHGEITVKGPTVMKGYLKNEAADKASFNDGWFKTGDIGYLDDDGFLYVLDRRSDLIISGGENIYPAEVEAVLLSHPKVAEAGVKGVDDKTWGKVPHAYLVADSPVDEEELSEFCKERLASYKVPKAFHFVGKLPRNASNKLMRHQL